MTTDSMQHLAPEIRSMIRALEQKSQGNAKDYYDAGVALYDKMRAAGQQEAAAYADFHIAVAAFFLYRWSEAMFHSQRAIVEFTRTKNWYLFCLSNNLLGIIFANQGDMALAINHFTETIRVADEHGVTYLSALARNNYAEACYSGRAYDTIIRVTEEAKELLLTSQDNPGWKGSYLSSLTQQVRAYLNLGQDNNARSAMRELDDFHARYQDLEMDLDEAIARLFFVVRFAPARAEAVLSDTVRHFDNAPDRNSYIYWIISLMEYLRAQNRRDLLSHVLSVMEKDMEKVSYPYFQLLLSRYRLDLMVLENRPKEEIYEQGLKRLALAEREQKQMTENLRYYIELQEEMNRSRKRIEEADAASKTDALTGLANRRAYEEEGERRFAKAAQEGGVLGVEILDIDRFKTINDTFGHEAGDRALQKLSRILKDHADDHCLPFRLGGDEFVILYEGLEPDRIRERANRLREALKNTCDPACPDITISQGICYGVPGEGTSLSNFLKMADECLYAGKDAGRDAIRVRKLQSGKDDGH